MTRSQSESDKLARLRAAGWKVGDAADFLGLSATEKLHVDLRLRLARVVKRVRLTLGLTREQAVRRLGISSSRMAGIESVRSADASAWQRQ